MKFSAELGAGRGAWLTLSISWGDAYPWPGPVSDKFSPQQVCRVLILVVLQDGQPVVGNSCVYRGSEGFKTYVRRRKERNAVHCRNYAMLNQHNLMDGTFFFFFLIIFERIAGSVFSIVGECGSKNGLFSPTVKLYSEDVVSSTGVIYLLWMKR